MKVSTLHRVRMRLGTRVAAIGSLVLVALWLVGSVTWVRRERERLRARPADARRGLRAGAEAALRATCSVPPREVDAAVRAALSAATAVEDLRAEFRRVRRRTEVPDVEALVREELGRAGLHGAWTREAAAPPSWTSGVRPRPWGSSRLDGACVGDGPDGAVLARCREVLVEWGTRRFLAGGLVVAPPPDVPGAWSAALAADPATVVLAGSGWSGVGASWEAETLSVAGLPVVLSVAVPPAPALRVAALAVGDAGPSTAAWRQWLATSGALLLVGVASFVVLGVRLNRAFAPLLDAAERLARDDLDVAVLSTRGDEIGLLGATLTDAAIGLRASRRAAAQAARQAAWREVARSMAHEIKNPLLPVRGTVENLLRWRKEDPRRFDENVESRLATILEEVDQLARLASSLSTFAQVEAPRMAPADLNALARDVVALHAAASKGVGIEDRLDPGLGPASCDAGQIRQVVTNLVKNALEAMGERGGSLVLESGRTRSGEVFLSVSDTGPGMDDATLERLFQPHVTTRRDRGGTGLGLWISQRLVVEHGGTLEARRRDGGGMTFLLTLPDQLGAGFPGRGPETQP